MSCFKCCIVFILFPLVLFGCRPNPEDTVQRSFCYWKSSFSIDSTDVANIKRIGITHFYLRFFDVDWDVVTASPSPVGNCNFDYRYGIQTDLTPTVFITNAVFENISDEKLEDFAAHFISKITKMKDDLFKKVLTSGIECDSNYKQLENTFPGNWSVRNDYIDSTLKKIMPEYFKRNNEILIDCDWTRLSMKKYFKFLSLLKTKMPDCFITSTLRLWQYRDFNLAGIPPVKKCLLMCYNMSDPRKYETSNSIASAEEFKKYFSKSKYPLNLDIALPLHRWAIYFRGNSFKGIVNGISEEEISKNHLLFEHINENRYRFLKDTVIQEVYYRNGDEFRLEEVDFKTLLEFAEIIKDHINIHSGTRVSFFSWDASFYNRLNREEYNEILGALGK